MTTTDLGTTPDGLAVVAVDLELRGVGGGLTPALRIDPALYEQGATIICSFEATVESIRFDPEAKAEPAGDQVRVHIAKATGALVRRAGDGDLEAELAEMRDKIARAKDAEKGILRLATDDELEAAHDAGEHADGLVDGCPECDRELELADAGT